MKVNVKVRLFTAAGEEIVSGVLTNEQTPRGGCELLVDGAVWTGRYHMLGLVDGGARGLSRGGVTVKPLALDVGPYLRADELARIKAYLGREDCTIECWAKHHPEEIAKNGRHFPMVYTCPWCEAPAYRAGSLEGEHLRQRYRAKKQQEDQERQALQVPALDPARIYLVSRGKAIDITVRFCQVS